MSVLQRFYAEYPREKYQIVAYELVSKSWLPVVGGIGGALLGAAIGIPAAKDSGDLESVVGIGFGAPAIGIAVGGLLGTLFKDKYIRAVLKLQFQNSFRFKSQFRKALA